MRMDQLDWEALDRLRETFLSEERRAGPYWHTVTDLECYDLTYGERIGWKWDAVLRELRARRRDAPAPANVLDWGCGSGVAGRRVVEYFGASNVSRLLLHDHSSLAVEYATHRAKAAFPSLDAERASHRDLEGDARIGVLVLSHVLNELDSTAQDRLAGLIARSDVVLWVEPGTHEVSRALGTWRERLRGDFRILAPCPHAGACGMFSPGNERHWCHFFAAPPASIFADSDWVKFGQRAGIDLRSLPYCFVALDRQAESLPVDAARIIGEPRLYKGYARLFSCDSSGINDLTLQKRDAPELFKTLKRETPAGLVRWTMDGGKITHADVD